MEALLTLAFAGWLGKKTVEAVVGEIGRASCRERVSSPV